MSDYKFVYPIEEATQDNPLPGYEDLNPQAKTFKLPCGAGHIWSRMYAEFLCGIERKDIGSKTMTKDTAIAGQELCPKCKKVYLSSSDRTAKRLEAWTNGKPLTSRHFE